MQNEKVSLHEADHSLVGMYKKLIKFHYTRKNMFCSSTMSTVEEAPQYVIL